MATSQHSKQVATLRTSLVISYVALSTASLVLAFILAWNRLSGTPWFLACAVSFGFWASVTATNNKVTAGDFLGVANVLKLKNNSGEKDAA